MAKLVNIKEAALHLGISTVTLRKESIRGQCPFIKLCGRYFYDIDVVDQYIKAQMHEKLTQK